MSGDAGGGYRYPDSAEEETEMRSTLPETAITAAWDLFSERRGYSARLRDDFVDALAAAAPFIAADARASEREQIAAVPEMVIKFDGKPLTPEALDAIKARFIEAQKRTKHGWIEAPEPVFEPITDLIAQATADDRDRIRRALHAELEPGERLTHAGLDALLDIAFTRELDGQR